MLAALLGTGKGVGAVIPNLLSYPDSMVVIDPKFENWIITSGFRALRVTRSIDSRRSA